MAQVVMHNDQEKDYKCDAKWKDGDVICLACDLDAMRVHVSRLLTSSPQHPPVDKAAGGPMLHRH
jgi:hypothetical protein